MYDDLGETREVGGDRRGIQGIRRISPPSVFSYDFRFCFIVGL